MHEISIKHFGFRNTFILIMNGLTGSDPFPLIEKGEICCADKNENGLTYATEDDLKHYFAPQHDKTKK